MNTPGERAHGVWCNAMGLDPWVQWTALDPHKRNAWDAVAKATPTNGKTLGQLERHAIVATLIRTGFNISRTCRELDIGRTTLYRKLKQYGWSRHNGVGWDGPRLENNDAANTEESHA